MRSREHDGGACGLECREVSGLVVLGDAISVAAGWFSGDVLRSYDVA